MPHRPRLIVVLTCAALTVCLCARLTHSQAGALRRITNTPEQALNLNPTLSGDGRHIAFESTENLAGAQSPPGFHALRADLDGVEPAFVQLAASRAVAPALSQDGARIAFASTGDLVAGGNLDGNSEIFLHEHGQLQQLTNTTPDEPSLRVQQGSFAPSLSDYGGLLAFASNRDLTGANADANLEIFIYDVARRTFAQVTNTSGVVGASGAKLSGDGRSLAFLMDRRASVSDVPLTRDLLLYDVTNGRTRVLAANVRGLTLSPGRAISDDGTRVVYAAETATNTTQVFLYDGRNDVVRQLTTLGSRVTEVPLNPTISGDGARVAFAARRNVVGGNSDGSVELYSYDVPANRFTRLTNAPAGATAEVVSSLNDDGTLVAFNFPRVLSGAVADSDLANDSEIYQADIEARPPFATDLRVTHGAAFGHEPGVLKPAAPDQIAVATGRNLALVSAQTQRQPDGSFPRAFANVTLAVNGRAAELLYVSPTQINFVVPPDTEPGLATVVARNHDGYEARGTVTILPAAPGIFTEAGDGTGAAIALEATSFLRTPFDPIDSQNNPRRLIIFATGVRRASTLTVSIGGRSLTVETVAPSPGLSGLDEIHVALTSALRGAGVVPVVVRADGRDSNPTTLQFGGVRRAASIIITPAQARVGVGRTQRLVATVLDEGGAEIVGASVAFTSSAPEIASVDAGGTVHGLSAGAATIRASSGGIGATAQIQVYPLTLVINEVLVDPPDGAAGDANRDGVRSAAQDEFVEIVNASDQDYDIGGYQLLTRTSGGADTVRHTFAAGTVLPPGTAVVIFGGAQAATFNSNDPAFGGAQVFTASTGGLSLLNGGSTVTLLDAGGALIEQMSYGDGENLPGDRDQSLTRAPDITGDFVPHQQVADSAGRLFSPGTRTDGTPFSTTAPVARVAVEPASAIIEPGAQQQFVAHAFAQDGRELSGVIFRWQTSDAAVATIDAQGLARGLAVGACEVTAQARGVRSSLAQLTVRETPPVLTRIEVTPNTVTLPTGVQQQFTARAFDQRGRELSGVAFAWATDDQNVAAIDQTGLANTVGPGATSISASAQGVTGTAMLNVVAPVLVINEVLADPPDGAAGDANHDGTRSGTDDEFIELVNASAATLDLSGWTIRTRSLVNLNETTRHTFAAGTTLAAGDAVVIFGGGSFEPSNPAFGGAQVGAASSGGLALTNGGLTVVVRDGAGRPAAQFAYGTANDDFGGDSVNQSITRAPDVTGLFTRHTLAPGAGGRRFSPGTRADGSFFVPRAGRLTRVQLTPTSASVTVGSATQFTAQAFDQYERALPGVTFNFTSSDTNVAAITDVMTDSAAGRATATVTGRGAGTAQIKVDASDGVSSVQSNEATLQVMLPPPVVQRVVVSPASATVNRGQAQQFVAQAFDQFDQPVQSASFSWTTSDAQVATVSSDGLARGVGLGTVNIVATTPDGVGHVVSGQATLTVRVPLVINEILADVPPDNANTPSVEGDANRDGVRSSDDDEFVELLNNSDAPLDLSGIVVADASANRFTFPPNTTLVGGNNVVIFGGGAPPAHDAAFGGALLFTTGSLSLNDGGDTVILKLPASGGNTVIATQSYGTTANGTPPAPNDQSLTRAPDAEVGSNGGGFVAHGNAPNADGRVFSPGTRADGTPFGAPAITRIEITPTSAQLDIGARQTFSARAFGQMNGAEIEVVNVSFVWDVSGASTALVAPLTGTSTEATAQSAGTTTVRARAGGQQAAATLKINPPPPVLTRLDLTPVAATIIVGQTQQFTARAYDQFDQPFTGASFSFNSDNTAGARVETTTDNGDGSATATVSGQAVGSAHITATAVAGTTHVNSNQATLTINPPPPVVQRVEVAPIRADLNRGQTQQFTAQAFNQYGQLVPDASFTWTTSAEQVASVSADGLARGLAPGTANIIVTTPDGAGGMVSGQAALTVSVPLVINEILADVPPDNVNTSNVEGDANRDGVRNSGDDEFIELLNNSNAPVDLSGVVIADAVSNRFTFPANTTLGGGRCLVVFGGGNLNAADPAFGGALIFKASSLSLNDGGDTVTVKLPASGGDILIAAQSYGSGASDAPPAPSDQSLTRVPDAETGQPGGNFVAHSSATNAGNRVFSPGTRADGTPFGAPPLTRIEVAPAAAQLEIGARQSFSARAFGSVNGAEIEVTNVSFIWDVSDATKATLAPATGASTTATASAAGTVTVRAQAGGQQATATLTINPPPPVLTRVELTPTDAAINVGQTQQLIARAFDQFDQPFTGATYNFTSDASAVAAVESVTNNADGSAVALVSGRSAGTAHISATAASGARNVTGNTATLTVNPPPPVLTRIVVSPAAATVAAGETQQFTARGFDQNDQEVAGLTFTWASSNPSVAIINQSGLATAISAGDAQITAASGNVTSDPAALSVTAPPVASAGQVIINEALVAFATSSTQPRSDFVELYNTTGQTLDISGLVVSFRPSGNSNTPATVALPGAAGSRITLIQPHGYFLVAGGADTFGVAADFDAHTAGFDLNNTTGGIKLELNGVKLDGLTYQGGSTPPVSTFVAYGEGTLLTFTGGTTNDLIRSPNATDTNNNATDFRRNGAVASVTPKAANP